MSNYSNIQYWNCKKLHKWLIEKQSVLYSIIYFSNHPLIINIKKILRILYSNKEANFFQHDLSKDELQCLWNIKDDAVKLKAVLHFCYLKWSDFLMNQLEYNDEVMFNSLYSIHKELTIVNNIAGIPLYHAFSDMAKRYPNFIGQYWYLISQRTGWKIFTHSSIKVGSLRKEDLDFYFTFGWILPNFFPDEMGIIEINYSYVMKSIYSTLNRIIENLFKVSKDIEDGIDWLFEEVK